MFVGHAALAFAIVALAARRVGVSRDRAVALGVAGALFATLPDVDMVYALTGLLHGPAGEPMALAHSFWAASTAVHRTITHSLVLAVPAAVAFALAGRSARQSALAGLLGAGIVAVAVGVTGPLAGFVAATYVVVGIAIGVGTARYGLGRAPVLAAAAVGLLSHPFGDVFTGTPPAFLYPLPVTLLHSRIALSSDPTLQLLGAFAVELAAIWVGLLAFAYLREVYLRAHLRPRAVAGVAYAAAVLALPPPTLDLSYPFVFSVLGVGVVGVVPLRRRLPSPTTAVVTGLAGVTLAGTAYAVAYLTLHASPLLAP